MVTLWYQKSVRSGHRSFYSPFSVIRDANSASIILALASRSSASVISSRSTRSLAISLASSRKCAAFSRRCTALSATLNPMPGW